jgi:integrase
MGAPKGKPHRSPHAGTVLWIKDRRRGTERCRGRVVIDGREFVVTRSLSPWRSRRGVEEEVWRELRALMADHLKEQEEGPAPADRTVRAQVEDFLAERKLHLRARSYENYESVARVHVLPDLGDLPLSELTRAGVVAWLEGKRTDPRPYVDAGGKKRKAKALSADRLNLLHVVLLGALKQAADEGRPLRKGVLAVKAPAIQRKRKFYATPKQVLGLFTHLRATRDRYYALWVLAFFTGCRLGELLGLRWSDVDWERRIATIAEKLPARPDRSQPRWEPTKTGIESEKPLPPAALTALRWHRLRQAGERAQRKGDHGLVFCREDGGPETQARARSQFRIALRGAALPWFPPKQLRHTCATLMRVAGNDLDLVSRLIGHRDVGTTAGVYIQPVGPLERAAVERLQALVFGEAEPARAPAASASIGR